MWHTLSGTWEPFMTGDSCQESVEDALRSLLTASAFVLSQCSEEQGMRRVKKRDEIEELPGGGHHNCQPSERKPKEGKE